MTVIKAGRAVHGAGRAPQGERPLPPSAVPFIVAIVAAFAVFIVVVGGVSIWTGLPSGMTGDRDPEA